MESPYAVTGNKRKNDTIDDDINTIGENLWKCELIRKTYF